PGLDVAGRTAKERRGSRGRKDQPQQQLQRGRLAGTVWPEKAEDFPRPHFERKAVERPLRPLPPESDRLILCEIDGFDGVHGSVAADRAGSRHGAPGVSSRWLSVCPPRYCTTSLLGRGAGVLELVSDRLVEVLGSQDAGDLDAVDEDRRRGRDAQRL